MQPIKLNRTGKIVLLLLMCFISSGIFAQVIPKQSVLDNAERVFDWQQKNPTGMPWWEWHYGAYYSGLMDLYKVDPKIKYLQAMLDMGNQYAWKVVPRPYDANTLCIAHMYLDLYRILGDPRLIDNTVYCLDASFERHPAEPDVTFEGNRYWYNWWTWCDALFMAPPAFAKYANISGDLKYLNKMDALWALTSNYLYDREEHLYYRDDRYFSQKTPNGKKMFWSRGNGWVLAGLAKVLPEIPENYPHRVFYQNQFQEMAVKIKTLQQAQGYWPSSLLDNQHYGGMESSGTAFFCYALAVGINRGLLERRAYENTVLKAWVCLVGNIQGNGKLGYVQQVGDSPENVDAEDSEAYGAGAFFLAASEVYKLLKK